MPLLERNTELAELRSLLDADPAAGRIALVSGEAGIGKTALIEAVAQETRRAAPTTRVLIGTCDALFTPRPLRPLLDIARQAGAGWPRRPVPTASACSPRSSTRCPRPTRRCRLHRARHRLPRQPAGRRHGFHYLNPALVDGEVTALEPELVIYEPQTNGRLRFGGLEYIIPYAILPETAPPPELFGQPFLQNAGDQLWMMHVWIGRHNPDGLLATRNPKVSCRFSN